MTGRCVVPSTKWERKAPANLMSLHNTVNIEILIYYIIYKVCVLDPRDWLPLLLFAPGIWERASCRLPEIIALCIYSSPSLFYVFIFVLYSSLLYLPLLLSCTWTLCAHTDMYIYSFGSLGCIHRCVDGTGGPHSVAFLCSAPSSGPTSGDLIMTITPLFPFDASIHETAAVCSRPP